ncbi:MAG: lyase family protein, partial [Actinomycetota bacterium]|nr:lyase family protein [Actinomycetota bacterium]
AGYQLEIDDAPLLHRGLVLSHIAHIIALSEGGVLPDSDRKASLAALVELADTAAEDFPYDPLYGDAYNSQERWLEQRIGPAAGWLAAGRPRREAGRIAFRIALRGRILDTLTAVARFAGALARSAGDNANVVMADYTYLQAAQPTTFGHYLLSFCYPALRDGERFREAHEWTNRSPGGAGGVGGTRYPVSRQRISELLGFGGVIEHTRDAMWQADGFVALLNACSLAAVNASRLAEDIEIYSSDEFSLVRLSDEFCRASALMPQKRNPYALVVIRGGAGTLIGRATGLMATQRTPSARTDNLLYAYGEVCSALETTTGLLDLATGVTDGLQPQAETMAASARESFAQAADLVEAISLDTGRDYRSCYRAVGRAVAEALDRGLGPSSIDAAAIERAAQATLGSSLEVPDEVIATALDPASAIAGRLQPVEPLAERCRAEAEGVETWVREQRSRADAAESGLLAEARRLV